MIHIKKNSIPNLKKVKFTCDCQLSNKLNEYELTKLLNKSHFLSLIGKGGSGKSSMMISLLKSPEMFKNVFEYIYVFIPPTSRASVDNQFWEKNLPEDQIYDDLTIENLEEVYEHIESNSESGNKSLIIFDDVQSKMKNNDIRKLILHLNNNKRHLKLSMWVLLQNYTKLDKQIRMNITDLIVFKISKPEMKNLYEEHIELDQNVFNEVQSLLFKKQYDFFYLNTNSQRLFSNWNEIIIDDE
jgi:hypothetical protein